MKGFGILLAAAFIMQGQPPTNGWQEMAPGQITRELAENQYPDAFDDVVLEGMTLGDLYDSVEQHLTFDHYIAAEGGNHLYVVRYQQEDMQRVIVVKHDDFGLSVVADTRPNHLLLEFQTSNAMDCDFRANEIRCVAIVGNQICLVIIQRNGNAWQPPIVNCTDL